VAPTSPDHITDGKGADPIKVLTYIMPDSASCEGAKFKDECATAADAAPHIVDGFDKYKITGAAEQAALISYMMFESGGFKYNKNHFPEPGRPGQGTRCMLMPNFVGKYAYDVKPGAVGSVEQILGLVMVPEFTYACAAWFHSTQCSDDAKKALAAGTTEGWKKWLKDCVGTTETDRQKTYDLARKALGVPVA
jgi:hypothetical protein